LLQMRAQIFGQNLWTEANPKLPDPHIAES